MPIKLTNPVIELALVTRQPEKMLDFYQNVLGLEYESQFDFPVPAGNQNLGVPAGSMQRLRCGGILLKLISCKDTEPRQQSPVEAYELTGYRFVTMVVENLAQVLEECQRYGAAVPVERRAFDASIDFAFIADPDGNWIELVEYT